MSLIGFISHVAILDLRNGCFARSILGVCTQAFGGAQTILTASPGGNFESFNFFLAFLERGLVLRE